MTAVNCHQCRHYFVTWKPAFPHGCRAVGMESRTIPALEVLRISGQPCLAFTPKLTTLSSEKPRR